VTCPEFRHWAAADRARLSAGLPYHLEQAPALARLVRLVAEEAAALAEDMGSLDAAARIRDHFGPAQSSSPSRGQNFHRAHASASTPATHDASASVTPSSVAG
jgi:hypothetical protein